MRENRSISPAGPLGALILLVAGILVCGLVYLYGVRNVAPVVDQLTPPDGTLVPATDQTTVAVVYHDNKNIDTARTTLVIDGNNVTPHTTITSNNLSWSGALALGTRRATATIVDKSGNFTSQTWYFTITPNGGSGGTGNGTNLNMTPLPTLTPIPGRQPAPLFTVSPGQLILPTLTPIPGQISLPTAIPVSTPASQ